MSLGTIPHQLGLQLYPSNGYSYYGLRTFVRFHPTIRGGFRPKYADGRRFRPRGDVKVAPDGRLWTSDGHALLRLDDAGIVDLVLGRAPQADELGKIAALTIDPQGKIYAVDRRTGSFPEERFDPPITVTDQGHVDLGLEEYALSRSRYLHFSADGTRLGIKQFKARRCYVQPGIGNILALAYDEAYLVNPNGQTIRTITRQPDGNWLESLRLASIASDGSFAMVARTYNHESPTVNLYDSTGRPIRTVTMPHSVGRITGIAYNGRHLVATGDGRVVVFDSTGSPVQTFKPVLKGEGKPKVEPFWLPLLVANGRELVLFDSESTKLWRYATE